jgi:hypothetical protein
MEKAKKKGKNCYGWKKFLKNKKIEKNRRTWCG